MSNENVPPFRCALFLPLKSCAQMCYYVYLLSKTNANSSHKYFNSSDCVKIRRNVSLPITLIDLLAFNKTSHKCFLFASRQLTFRHKFDCCDATLNIILTRQFHYIRVEMAWSDKTRHKMSKCSFCSPSVLCNVQTYTPAERHRTPLKDLYSCIFNILLNSRDSILR